MKKMLLALALILSLVSMSYGYDVPVAADNSSNNVQKVPVIGARANAAAPAWSEGKQVPLSVDTSGALRITGAVSGRQTTVSNIGTTLTTNGCVQLVAPSGSTAIKVYTVNYVMSGTTVQIGNLYFGYGLGSNCSTGGTVITSYLTYQNNAMPMQFSGGSIPLFVTPASQGLCACVANSNTLTGAININYIQE